MLNALRNDLHLTTLIICHSSLILCFQPNRQSKKILEYQILLINYKMNLIFSNHACTFAETLNYDKLTR